MSTPGRFRTLSRRLSAASIAGLAVALSADLHLLHAAIVHRVVNIPLPVTQNGLWINLETQATSTTSSPPAGWDFNFYNSGAYQGGPADGMANLVLYTGSSNGSGFMRFPGTTSGTPSNLPAGTTVASYGSYGAGYATFGTQIGTWKLAQDNLVGLKFIAGDGQLRYGWARIAVGANSFSRTLVEYAYESTPNTCIAVGATTGAPPRDCAAPPPYDPCAPTNPQLTVGNNLPIANQTTTTSYTLAGGCGFTMHRANFYRFTPTTSGRYSVNTCGTSVNTKLAILTDCTPSAAVIACNDDYCALSSAVTFDAVAGQTVWVVAGGSTASTGLPAFMPIAIEPPFDPCANPPAVALGDTVVSTNSAVPALDMTGYCDSGPIHPSIIYKANYARWTAPKTGYYAFGICQGDVSAHVAVLAACGDASTAIACSYDKCLAPNGARVEFWADGGTEYVLAFGVDNPIWPLPANVTLEVDVEEPPPEPCGEDLLEATLGMQSIRLDFEFPNLSLVGSPCSFAIGDQALRYPKYLRFVPPYTGTYTMGNCSDTDPSFWGIYDLRIAVMTDCGDASTIFACDDNGCHGDAPPWTARIRELPLQAGVPVYIGLGGNGPAAPGPFAFEIAFDGVPPCAGDLDGNGSVDAADLSALLGAWGSPNADVDGNGTTDAADLSAVLAAWGPCGG
jgi:hypothetical protein